MIVDHEYGDEFQFTIWENLDHFPAGNQFWLEIELARQKGIDILMKPVCDEMMRQCKLHEGGDLLIRLKQLWQNGLQDCQLEHERRRIEAMIPTFETIDDQI